MKKLTFLVAIILFLSSCSVVHRYQERRHSYYKPYKFSKKGCNIYPMPLWKRRSY